MDEAMDYVSSDQAQYQQPAPMAGHDLHQHQVDQRLHSPILGPHQYQHVPSTFLSPTSFQPVEKHPQQHQYCHQNQSKYSHQPPAGFNASFNSPPLCFAHPVVQQTPLPPPTVQFPLNQKQSEQYIQQIREASDRYFESMQQLLQIQYESNMEAINHQFHLFSLYLSTRSQQSVPTVTLSQGSASHQVSHKNASTVLYDQQPSMDQLIVPATTADCDNCDQEQQKEGSNILLAVPTPDGSSEIEIQYAPQNPHAAEVFNSCDVESPQEELINFNQHPAVSLRSVIHSCDTDESIVNLFHLLDLKFAQHFLDRNGHRMDSPCGRASVFSDVFEWIVNHGGLKIKLRFIVHQSSSTRSPATLETTSTIIALPTLEDRCHG